MPRTIAQAIANNFPPHADGPDPFDGATPADGFAPLPIDPEDTTDGLAISPNALAAIDAAH